MSLQLFIVYQGIYLYKLLAKFPVNLGSFHSIIVNTTSTFSYDWWVATEWQGFQLKKLDNEKCKKGSYTCNYKCLEIHFWNIQFIISQECTELLVWISPLIYSHPRSFSGWMLQWIAGWNACLYIYHLVSTTSTSIGVVGSYEMVGNSDSNILYGQMASI